MSLDFVVTDRQLLRQSPEELSKWIAKVAARNLYLRKSELILSGFDSSDEP